MSEREDGWRLVPVEPTDAMIEAIEFAIYRYSDCTARDAERGAPYVYSAILALASPLPLPEPGEGDAAQSLPSGEASADAEVFAGLGAEPSAAGEP